MKLLKTAVLAAGLLLGASFVYADSHGKHGADKLIAMDKAWGEATSGAAIDAMIADDILSISAEGLADKAAMLAAQDEPLEGPYIAGDYQVKFLSDDIAVMVHSSGGEQPHWSMHVWQKADGKWVVKATASAPILDE